MYRRTRNIFISRNTWFSITWSRAHEARRAIIDREVHGVGRDYCPRRLSEKTVREDCQRQLSRDKERGVTLWVGCWPARSGAALRVPLLMADCAV